MHRRCATLRRPPTNHDNPEDVMSKGQIRSNKEKKKPKQDKNKKKGGSAAPSPFAGMHSQAANPNAYGKKS
jgi:hypothetical protein